MKRYFGCVALENKTHRSLRLCQNSVFQVFTSMYEFDEACLPPTVLHNTLQWSRSSTLTSAHTSPFQHLTSRGFEGTEANDLWVY